MAFLVIGAVHQAIKGVQSGIQAHKDFKNPIHVVDPSTSTNANPPVDRYGHAKEHHPVYGWVMKAEHKFNTGKGRAVAEQGDGPSRNREVAVGDERGMNKEEYDKQRYTSAGWSAEDGSVHVGTAPPTYEAAISSPSAPAIGGSRASERSMIGQYGNDQSYHSDGNYSDDTLKPTQGSYSTNKTLRRTSTGSSLSSDSSDSDSGSDQATTSTPSTRHIRKNERRVRKAERKLHRATARAERHAERREERGFDARRVRRAEERLEIAKSRLDGARA